MQGTEGIVVPDSPYAVQLQQGFRGLRFVRALEREFANEFAQQHLTRMRMGFVVAIVMYSVFLLMRLGAETGAAGEWIFALRGTIIGAMVLAYLASFVQRLRGFMPLLVMAAYAIFAVGVTGIEVLAHRHGLDRHYEGLILVSFHAYMFSGLLMRPALAMGVFIFLSYVVGGALGGLAGKPWAYQVLFIALTQIIGAAALYSMESVERDSFLRRKLFGMLATHDGLTGLLNRMAFFGQFERVARHAAREGRAIGLVLFDIDHFKKYNDQYGHLEGDACLRAVAQAAQGEFKRSLDVLARYGGEEFIGLWHDVQPRSVRLMAESLRSAVEALRIPHRGSPHGRVTISVGAVACIPREDESLVELIKRADDALYAAKDKGRNTVLAEIMPSAMNPPDAQGRRAPTLSRG
jgi:diguanylate cyclase (GGDEF)-like protein